MMNIDPEKLDLALEIVMKLLGPGFNEDKYILARDEILPLLDFAADADIEREIFSEKIRNLEAAINNLEEDYDNIRKEQARLIAELEHKKTQLGVFQQRTDIAELELERARLINEQLASDVNNYREIINAKTSYIKNTGIPSGY